MSSSTTVSRYRESSAVTSPTKIYDLNDSSFAEDYAFDAIAKEAELRLQHQREQNREARQIRNKELAKNARDEHDDDNDDSPTIQFQTEIKPPNSLLLQKFLNGDIDLRSIEQRDLRRLLTELESKYNSLMITNSSLYNEKQALYYQIDTYKDLFDEHYESFNQAKRQLKEKSRELDFQKQILIDLEQNNNHLKEILINCERLIQKSEKREIEEIFCVHQSLEDKIRRILNEKSQQFEEILQLKFDFDQEKTRSKLVTSQISNAININNISDFDQQKQLIREISDLKNRLQKFEVDNISFQQENKRYEAQLTRYKQQLDDVEHIEEELKQERRRFQRELRTTRDELENERTRIDLLQRENRRLRQKNCLQNSDDELVNHLQSISPLEDSI